MVQGFYGTDYVGVLPEINISNPNILFAYSEYDVEFPNNVVGISGMMYSNVNNFLDSAY